MEMMRTVYPAPLTYFMVNPRPVSQYCDSVCVCVCVCVCVRACARVCVHICVYASSQLKIASSPGSSPRGSDQRDLHIPGGEQCRSEGGR